MNVQSSDIHNTLVVKLSGEIIHRSIAIFEGHFQFNCLSVVQEHVKTNIISLLLHVHQLFHSSDKHQVCFSDYIYPVLFSQFHMSNQTYSELLMKFLLPLALMKRVFDA